MPASSNVTEARARPHELPTLAEAARTPYMPRATREAIVGTENWHEERDRLVQLLEGIESGKITHIDEEDLRQLQATNPENIAVLKERLAKLNARLGDD